MSKVKYSKTRMIGQSQSKSLKYMAPLKPGTVLTITDVLEGTFEGADGPVMNDSLICADNDGNVIKVPVREYNKMKLTGEVYNSESDSDEISLPNQIHISGSEDREFTPRGEDTPQKLYPTFAYNDAQAFVESKGAMSWEELIASGVKEDNTFAPVQNYSGEVK